MVLNYIYLFIPILLIGILLISYRKSNSFSLVYLIRILYAIIYVGISTAIKILGKDQSLKLIVGFYIYNILLIIFSYFLDKNMDNMSSNKRYDIKNHIIWVLLIGKLLEIQWFVEFL